MSQKYAKKKRKQNEKKPLPLALLLGVGGLLLMLAAGVAFLVQNRSGGFVPEVTGAPKLKVDQELLDFGTVRLGKTVQASFTLTNVGDKPLMFTKKPYIEVLEGC